MDCRTVPAENESTSIAECYSPTSCIFCLTFRVESMIEQRMSALREFLHRMGREAKQGAIGLVIDDDYLEIGFPLEATPTSERPKGKKRK